MYLLIYEVIIAYDYVTLLRFRERYQGGRAILRASWYRQNGWYIRNIVISRISIYPDYRYIQIIDISRISIHPDYRYIQTIDISRLSIYPEYRYIQYIRETMEILLASLNNTKLLYKSSV